MRYKTFDSTGVATGGRAYAGDFNAIQDMKADVSNFSQAIDLASIQIGESGLSLLRFGSLDARLTGALRTDGIMRPLGGVVFGAFTTTQRDAIGVGLAPYGIKVFNVTTNRFEWNSGTDVARVWRPEGFNGSGQLVFPDATVMTTAATVGEVDMGLLVALT